MVSKSMASCPWNHTSKIIEWKMEAYSVISAQRLMDVEFLAMQALTTYTYCFFCYNYILIWAKIFIFIWFFFHPGKNGFQQNNCSCHYLGSNHLIWGESHWRLQTEKNINNLEFKWGFFYFNHWNPFKNSMQTLHSTPMSVTVIWKFLAYVWHIMPQNHSLEFL